MIIVLQQEPHAVFQRSGDNLVMKHKINLVESLCGFQLVITHLDGRQIVMKHPANDPIAPGTMHHTDEHSPRLLSPSGTYRCLKGQGMINMRTHDSGDLIVQFDVEFPTEKSPLDPQAFKVSSLNALVRDASALLVRRNSNVCCRNARTWTFPKASTSKTFT